MKNGKYQGRHEAKASSCGQKRIHLNGRLTAMVIATVMLLALAIGGTVAWLTSSTGPITNTFTPSHVTCEVTEDFNGTVKSNVNVKNTSDNPAFIRVKLVTYRVNDADQHIGGTATIPTFNLGTDWVKHGEYYYYTKPVAPNASPEAALTASGITLQTYTDVDGGKQVIEVMAEAIQSMPERAVGEAWGVTITPNSVVPYNAG